MYDSRLTLGKFVLFAVMPNILPDFGEKLALKLKNHLLPLSTTENPDYKSVWCVRPPAHVAARSIRWMDGSIDRCIERLIGQQIA